MLSENSFRNTGQMTGFLSRDTLKTLVIEKRICTYQTLLRKPNKKICFASLENMGNIRKRGFRKPQRSGKTGHEIKFSF